jgi:DNA-binding transcriptional MerR regulator
MDFKELKIKGWILPVIAVATFGITRLFIWQPDWTEKIYSDGIYPVLASILSSISVYSPFSLDDLFYILLILSGILLIVLMLSRKISWKKALRILLNVLAATYILFYLLWGFNYFRPGLSTRLNLPERNADTTEFIPVLKKLIDQTNTSYCRFEDFNKQEIDQLVEDSYQKLAPVLQIKYPSGKRKPKKITFSRFYAKAGISGYYGPFFSEVQVNSYNLPIEYPFVLAHEKAHQFGITSEAEANFYAWLVCTQSNNKQLQYSANLTILRFFLYQGYRLKQYPEIIKQLNEPVKEDFRRIREHWTKLRNDKVDRVATKVNDTYLKTNKVEKGIEDYTGVVLFVMDFKLDTAFQKKWNLNSD